MDTVVYPHGYCCFQTIEIAAMKVTKKVKSMQVFRKPVSRAVQVGLYNLSVQNRQPNNVFIVNKYIYRVNVSH